MNYSALRYFNVAGYDVDGELYGLEQNPANLIPVVMETACGMRKEMSVFGDDYETRDGTCIRDYVHLKDLSSAHILALEKNALGAYNLGTGKGISVMEIVETCRKVTGRSIPVSVLPRRPGDPPALFASGNKARKIMGWAPVNSNIETIIKDAWVAHQKWPNGYDAI